MDQAISPDSLSTAFTVWAAVVALIGALIIFELARARLELKNMSEQMHQYVVSMERRVSTIETFLRLTEHHAFKPHE
jgi:hypothetical protein